MMYLCPQIIKTKQDMEVISIERSTYEELLTSFNSFVAQMRALADRGTDKGFFASKANKFERGDWLDNQDVCQILNISPRTLQTLRDNGTLAYSQSTASCSISLWMWRVFFMLWLVGIKMARCITSKRSAYERTDNAA